MICTAQSGSKLFAMVIVYRQRVKFSSFEGKIRLDISCESSAASR